MIRLERLDKFKAAALKRADAVRDIALVNQYAQKELAPEDVYCFSLVLCDNDLDRDGERFTVKTLRELAPLFVGKPGILDHYASANNQTARVYRADVAQTGETNSIGEPLVVLRADAYMLRTEDTRAKCDAIEGGILREVSVGVRVKARVCSICGKPMRYYWATDETRCEDKHVAGETYDGKQCFPELDGAEDAYEFSFVGVPAQRRAGVTKSVGMDADAAVRVLMSTDLSACADMSAFRELLPRLQLALKSDADRAEIAKILKNNEKYLKKEGL